MRSGSDSAMSEGNWSTGFLFSRSVSVDSGLKNARAGSCGCKSIRPIPMIRSHSLSSVDSDHNLALAPTFRRTFEVIKVRLKDRSQAASNPDAVTLLISPDPSSEARAETIKNVPKAVSKFRAPRFRDVVRWLREGLISLAKKENRPMVLCKVLFFFFYASNTAYGPFVPLLLASVGGNPVEIGVVFSIRPLISFVSMPAIGFASDKLARPALVLFALLTATLSLRLTLLQCTSFAAVSAVLCLSDFFGNPIVPILDSTALDAIADPLLYGRQRMWGTIGCAVAGPLTGLAVSRTTTAAALWIHVALYTLVILIVPSFRVKPAPPRPAGAGGAGGAVGLWLEVLRDRRTACLCAATVGMGQAYGAVGAFLFMRLRELGASPLLMGLTILVNAAVEAPMFHVAGDVIGRLGLVRVMLVTLGLMAGRLGFYGVVREPWAVLAVEGVHGVTFALLWTAGTAHMREVAPKGMGATMQGLYTALKFGVGTGTGGLLGGVLARSVGLEGMFLCLSAYIAIIGCGIGAMSAAGLLSSPSAAAAGGGGGGGVAAAAAAGGGKAAAYERLDE